ncbi:porin-like protein, partial [Roseiarcus fermentans]
MTLIKSILLGSAAAIVAVAGAQAADLPTKKAAPVAQYVKICNVGGITGWTLPGSDTCVKFSGYITAQVEGGNLSTQYNQGGYSSVYNAYVGGGGSDPTTLAKLATGVVSTGGTITGGTASGGASSQRILVEGSRSQGNDTWSRNAIGWTTRANFGFDMASNTAYGPLIGHFDLNANMGSGFDNTGSAVLVNTAYLTWAGITA